MSTQIESNRRKVTVRTLQQRKEQGQPITMITAYDYSQATVVEAAGADVILVGDSLGMVVLGYENTLSVTLADMLHHCKAVARGARSPLLVGDMPFMSYQADPVEALHNAARFLAEAGMDAVKLEGGAAMTATVRRIVDAGIPVMGHVGLTPQSVHALGGYLSQGRTAATARRILDDALALQAAGCFAIVLEAIPARLAEYVSGRLTIPTIGIGAGNGCDGQVLVFHDLLGLFDRFVPKFVKQYAHMHGDMAAAIGQYMADVQARTFPAEEHTFAIKDAEWEAFLAGLQTN